MCVEIVTPVGQRLELACRQAPRGKGKEELKDEVVIEAGIRGRRAAEEAMRGQVELQEGSFDKVTNWNIYMNN